MITKIITHFPIIEICMGKKAKKNESMCIYIYK